MICANFPRFYAAANNQLIDDWQKEVTKSSLKDSILLAFTRAAVTQLNEKARHALKEKNRLGNEEIIVQGIEHELKISTGERLLFRQNNRDVGVRNGDLGTVKAIHKEQLQVELDSGEILTIPKAYQAMDYGYALTVHKSQGMTTEHSKVLIDSQYWDKHLSFVAMTRHKQSLTIYADTLNHPDLSHLKRTLSRSVTKDNVIDWPLNFAIRAGFNPDKLMGKVVNHLAGIGHQIKDCFNYVANYKSPLRRGNLKASHPNKTASHESVKKSAHPQNNQRHHQGNDTWKTQFPVLTEYDALLKQRLHLSGYYREKLDKKVHELSQKILKDKKITTELQQRAPQVLTQLRGQANQHLNKELEHEL